ncbi:MAG: fosfomycin resistance glutathione transferase [Gammaproteobacteria bacterium]|nr:fosfomycin resistance glutathione transferase [Gammaproteobacteria bacterium]
MLLGLNHITISVRNVERSLLFYTGVLGFKGHVKWDGGAYLSIGNLWFCLSLGDVCSKTDYTHIAFNISDDDFTLFSDRVVASDLEVWKVNTSEGKSLYILDPDGHKLEIHAGSLQTRLAELREKPYSGLTWL